MDINNIDKSLLALLRSSLFNEDIATDSDILSLSAEEWSEVYNRSYMHCINGLAYEGTYGVSERIPKDVYEKWLKSLYQTVVYNQKILYVQTELVKLLESAGIDYVILKGTSVSISYPKPMARRMGDIDFLVKRSDMNKAGKLLTQNGYKMYNTKNHTHHLEFTKSGIEIEMHFRINGIPEGETGDRLSADMDRLIIPNSVVGEYDGKKFCMPDVFEQAVVMITHMEYHITGDGIGLRQLCDWAVFVHYTLTDSVWKEKLAPYLKEIGLYNFTEYMNELCFKYLGMPKREWMREMNDGVSESLIYGIIIGGNFGKKNDVGKYSGIIVTSGRETSAAAGFFKHMGVYAREKWPVDKHPILLPVAYVYFPVKYVCQTLTGKRPSVQKVLKDKQKRESIFDKMKIYEKTE